MKKTTAAVAGEPQGVSTARLGKICDILLVLGGDGTILQVLHDLGKNIKPIFGINLGSLGFLTCVNSSAYLKAVDSILARDYVLSQRTLLSVEIQRKGKTVEELTGLNDAVISRGAHSRLIRLRTRIDHSVLTEYNADGLIVATPTGSTAYSLSAGGPILMPDSGVFVITPICPHVLTNRAVIVSDRSEIEVRPCPEQDVVFLAVDGQEPIVVKCGDTIRIFKSSLSLPLAMLPEMSFSEVLRQKLKSGAAARCEIFIPTGSRRPAICLRTFSRQRGLALEMALVENFDGLQCRRADDEVLHAFDVVMDDLVVEAEELEEIGEEMVAVGDVAGQFFPGGGEGEAAVFLVFEQALGVEALDHVRDARLRDFEAGGDVHHARVALGIDQFQDALEVILDGGGTAEGG